MSKNSQKIISQIWEELNRDGYNPAFQFAQFLATGEPAFLTKGARLFITNVPTDILIEELVDSYFKQK